MPRDHLAELALLDLSRAQRMAWERLLLLTAGISPAEAETIVTLAEKDRQAVAAVEMEFAA
ncbi:hypothetical protein FJ959_22160 [Mesorhizobium sp. B2-2-4]|uniref:hypothetical protein n=1 Tax=unclassified Mesorhizobium TaxID=325217 RepID=UPI001128BD06|nr:MULTISPECIES: hypothetical protein [unclassified Mesorhizobium]TPM53238.1 hypothetical protein FJ959_22160 [Mesorhizobium sp. B2-2-4]TPM62120.1 hypothetical protein FJ965_21210 [Mesorhizobium sp. B2-2-1]TPN68491.1 hypothetical protein FJ984_11690 [Mesorhizobium sp. B1-1-3]